MNNIFLLIFCISFLCIPIFIIWAVINLIQKKQAKKRFASAGISALALIISTVGFGLTMDDTTASNESVNVASENSVAITESPTLMPTMAPTPRPTATPTAQPTEMPTPQPTKTPVSIPTASPTPQPTEIPTEAPQPTVTPQTENTSAPPVIVAPTSQPVAMSDSQSAITSSNGNVESGSGGNNFDTYDNQSQQQTTDTYVLNTKSKKIHHPNCSSVPKIAPHNYATSSASLEELKSQDYTTCGNCFK